MFLAFLCDSLEHEELENGDTRSVMKIHPFLSAYKAAVLPLSKKLSEQAEAVYADLSQYFNLDYDQTGSIGKRYRRQDEIGTPFCITVDFDTAEDHAVTIRDRDTMEQVRLPIAEVKDYIAKRIAF